MNLKILLLPGDGIGAEVTSAAVVVLKAVASKFGHTLKLSEGLLGGIAIHKTGTPFPEETKKLAMEADATLMGAVIVAVVCLRGTRGPRHIRRYTSAAANAAAECTPAHERASAREPSATPSAPGRTGTLAAA